MAFAKWIICAGWTIVVLLSGAAPASSSELPPDVEQALLDGDWRSVYQLLDGRSETKDDPIHFILWAQACVLTDGDCPPGISKPSFVTPDQRKLFSDWLGAQQELYPDNSCILYLSGFWAVSSGRMDEAFDYLDRAIAKDSGNAPAFALRGILKQLQGNPLGAEDDFHVAIGADPTFSQPHVFLGANYMAQGRYAEALASFDTAEAVGGHNTSVYGDKGSAYLLLEDTAMAIAYYSEALRVDSSIFTLYLTRGLIYQQCNLDALVLGEFESYLKYVPRQYIDTTDTTFQKIQIYVNTVGTLVRNQFEELDTPDFMLELARQYWRDKDYLQDMACCTRAVELDPTQFEAYAERGYAFEELHRPKRALHDLNRAVDLAPQEALAYQSRAYSFILRWLNDLESETPEYGKREAIADFTRVLTDRPNDIGCHYYRGRMHDLLGDIEEARVDYEFVIERAAPEDSVDVRHAKQYLEKLAP